jgi:putative monooxygenase
VTETRVRLDKVAAASVVPNRRRGGDIRVVLGPKTCGATTGFMGSLTLAPGEYVSEHYHPYSEEFLYVVRGSVTARIDGEQRLTVSAGEGLMIPRNVRHRVSNGTGEQAHVVFHLCPLAPRPELGHVDTEPPPNASQPPPEVGHPQGPVRP